MIQAWDTNNFSPSTPALKEAWNRSSRVINLSKRFDILPAVQQVSFDILPGEVVGLTGNIGSGKSVLVMLLAGLYEPNDGNIYFDNRRLIWPFNAKAIGIGVIHQRPNLQTGWTSSAISSWGMRSAGRQVWDGSSFPTAAVCSRRQSASWQTWM